MFAPLFIVRDTRIGDRLIIEMFGQIHKMFWRLQIHITFKRPMTCHECGSRNTYLMKRESKALEDIGFAWYECRNCGDKFTKQFYRKAGQKTSR